MMRRGMLIAACMAMIMSGVSAIARTTGAVDAYQGARDSARGIFSEPVGALGISRPAPTPRIILARLNHRKSGAGNGTVTSVGVAKPRAARRNSD